jgi:kynureninase
MDYQNSIAFAKELDAADRLRDFRNQFFIPQHNNKDAIYFNGNSLGLQPKATIDYINQELEDWAALGVMGHTNARNPWVNYHEYFAEPLGRITGALPSEVVAMNQLTVNLHLLLATFYRPTSERFKIICEAKAFPSDQYALESQVKFHGFDPSEAIIQVHPKEGESIIRMEDILHVIGQHGSSTAVVLFGGVNYYTGQVFDMAAITQATHQCGAYAGFDLAHAAGNIQLQLHDWDIDFACWCSYKYLNSGPGGVAGAFIHEKHAKNQELPRLAGWWGTSKKNRFQMHPQFDPIPTAEGWQVSNAPVLSMAAHKAALAIFDKAGMESLVLKSTHLTKYLLYILRAINEKHHRKVIQLITPEDAHGCQVSLLMLEKGRAIFEALIDHGVISDWREPNVIRLAPVPLYNSFEDVWTFGNIIQTILDKE